MSYNITGTTITLTRGDTFKDIPIDTMMLTLEPQDTADLNFGKYVYDIQLTKANGKVDTFISKAILKLSEEVD